MATVNFKVGTLAQYTATSKTDNTLYFVTDAQRIYKGTVDVTQNLVVVTGFDGEATGNITLQNAFEGKLYLNATTYEVRIKNGAAWSVLSPGYITDGVNFANAASNDKLATIGAIKAYITSQISEITDGTAFVKGVTFDSTTHALLVDNGDTTATSVPLTGMAYTPTYDSSTLTLTIPVVGGDPVVVNLPKDNFVRSGRYEASYTLPDSSTGPAIVLVVNDGTQGGTSSEVVIPAAALIDVYTGGTSDNVTVTVAQDNTITASVVIDPAANNALVSSATGLKVDISGKADKLTAAAATHVLVGGNDGNIADSNITIKSSGTMGTSAAEVPTASLVAAAIAAAVQAAQGTLQDEIDALSDRIDGLAGTILDSGTADEVITSTATGITRSGKTIGGATLAASPDADTLATEAAVAAVEADILDVISWTNM